jgi:thiamine-monophosphate kinase
VPLSEAAAALLRADPALLPRILTGGDDYELLFAAPPAAAGAIAALATSTGTPATRIGRFVPGAPAATVLDEKGLPLPLVRQGWSHF